MRYLLEQSDETLTTHSGMALVGLMLSKTELEKKLNRTPLPDRATPNIPNFEVIDMWQKQCFVCKSRI